MALPPGPLDLAPPGRAQFIFTAARHPGSARQRHLCRVLGTCSRLGGDLALSARPLISAGPPSSSNPEAPGMRALGWGWWGRHYWLATTVPRLVAFGLAPCLPATPTPCPGRAERLLLPVSILKFKVGVGEHWVPPCPLPVLCHLGLVPLACYHAQTAFPLPLCSLELGDDACLAPVFLLTSSLPLLLSCNGSPFWHLLPSPSHRRQLHSQTLCHHHH